MSAIIFEEINRPLQRPQKFLWLVLIGLLIMATALRLRGLFTGSLHADEALFATWARMIGTWQDPLLRHEMVDKPPLLFYMQALFYPLIGSSEGWVSRLPNLAASIFIVPLTARFAWKLYGNRMAMITAAILATFSPILISFSNTSFTDPFMTALLTASLLTCCAGVRAAHEAMDGRGSRAGRYALVSGLLMGLALATKYQAVFFIPLQIGLGWLWATSAWAWRRWVAGLVLPLAGLAIWGALRHGAPGLWQLQLTNYGGLRASRSWELWPRLEQWGELWSRLIDAPVLGFALVLFTPVFLALLIQRQDRETALDQLLVLFVLAYALAHWFVAVPVWDRYLLPVAPVAIVLLSRFVARVVHFVQPALPLGRGWFQAGVAGAVLILSASAGMATYGGGDHDDGAGGTESSAALVAEFLADSPYGAVLYDHWFSWQLRYELLDSRVYVSWFAHPDALVDDVDAFLDDQSARYIVLPRQAPAVVVIRQLRQAGYRLDTALILPDMTLYQIRKG